MTNVPLRSGTLSDPVLNRSAPSGDSPHRVNKIQRKGKEAAVPLLCGRRGTSPRRTQQGRRARGGTAR